MAINLSEKYRQSLMEGFNASSRTNDLFSHDMDMEFSGVKTVHVTSVITEEMQDYNRGKDVGTGSRYGDTKEVQDEVQTFEMTQDKSLSLSIDKGNNKEQFNMKQAGKVMKAEREERIMPEVDRYRLAKWAKDAGIHYEIPASGMNKNAIAGTIIAAKNEMLEKDVPEDQIVLVISRKHIPALKLADEWVKLDSLGGKTLPKGTIAEFDGMPVHPVNTNRMPKNVEFMLIFKGAVISPMKINDFKAHIDPPGLSGDLLEFRMIYDAFVLGRKSAGVCVGVANGKVVKAPTFSKSGTLTIESATSAATIMYTTDGSDPRYSPSAKLYASPVTMAGVKLVKAYAYKEDPDTMYASAVSEYANT